MLNSTRDTLTDRLSGYRRVVEVGIGREPAVAASLTESGVEVTATDLHPREVPPAVAFALDDLTAPERSLYAGAGAIYGLNLPPELHRPALELTRDVGAEFLFTTLGGDPPAVPVSRETVPAETLYIGDP